MKAVAFAALLALCAAASNAAQPCAQMRTRQLGTQWRGQDQVPSCARLWSTGRAAVLLPADSTFVIHGVIDLGIQGASSAGPTSRSLAGQAAARVELGELGLDDESESGNDDNKMAAARDLPPGIALPTLQLNSPTDLVSPPPGATAIDVNIVNGPAPTIQALPTGIALPTLQVPVESALLPPHAEMTVNGPAPSIQARPVTAPTAPPQPAAAPGASNQLPLVAPLGSDAVVTTINGPAPTAQPEAAGAPDVLSAQPLASPLPDPAGVLPVNDPVQPSEQHIVQTPLPVTQQRKSATTKRPGQTPGPKLSKAVFTDRNGRTYPILSTAIPQIASNQLLAQTIFRGYLTAEGQVFLASPYLYVEKRAMVRAFQGTYMNATATNLAPPAQVPSAAQIYINFGTNVTGSTLYGQVANRFPSKKKQTRCGTSLADTAAQKAYYNGLIPTDLAKLEWVPATSKTLNSAFVVKFGSVGSGYKAAAPSVLHLAKKLFQPTLHTFSFGAVGNPAGKISTIKAVVRRGNMTCA